MESATLVRHIKTALGRQACELCQETAEREGRYPLEIRYSSHSAQRDPLNALLWGIKEALTEAGDILVFVPGMREIRALERSLRPLLDPRTMVLHVLHAEIASERQSLALLPDSAGRRRIILATTIAESSLTIEGVRLVVDSGLVRRPLHDHARGLTRLVTMSASLASVTQRAGRAARTGPGIAWRLWSRAEERSFPAGIEPEIKQADLAPLLLGLAAAGAVLPPAGDWLDPPSEASVGRARALLEGLTAFDTEGRITPLGSRMARIPLHPRFARMLASVGRDQGRLATAIVIAALLDEGDFLPAERGPWIEDRVALLLEESPRNDAQRRIRRTASILARRLGTSLSELDPALAGEMLALAWPERIAISQKQGWLLAGGGLASLAAEGTTTLLVAPDLEVRPEGLRVRLAARLPQEVFERLYPLGEGGGTFSRYLFKSVILDQAGRPRAFEEIRFGALVLEKKERQVVEEGERAALLAAGLVELARREGEILPESARQFVERISFLRETLPETTHDWPDVNEESLCRAAAILAQRDLSGCHSLSEARQIDWIALIRRLLGAKRMALLEREAPAVFETPAGTRTPIRYSRGTGPTAGVRLQQVFGLLHHPRLAQGRVALALELLSPAGRPLQLTRDIAGFWQGSYLEVRKEMKGRYPKHDWPEDGAAAQATRLSQRQKRVVRGGS